MALARSASGPGGLSINTGSANSLFSSISQTPVATGLFGSSKAATSAPQSQGILGAPQAIQSSGGLLGGSMNTASTSQAGGGLFGSTSTASQPQQTGGLFGNLNTMTQPQQSGGSLFGSLNNSIQPQQNTGGFGNLGSQPAQNQNSSTGGIFGSTIAGQKPAQTGGLFSGFNNQPQNKLASASPFGGLNSQNQQPQQQQTSSFLSSLNKPAQASSSNAFGNTLGGGLKMGQSQAPSVPGVRIDVSLMRGTTRFNDLHEDLQKQIENIDKIILAQQALSGDCEAIMPSHASQLSCIPADVDFLTRKLIGVESSLESDAEAVSLVGHLVKLDAENAKLSFKTIDNLKLPPQYHHPGNWIGKSTSVGVSPQDQDSSNPQDLVSFFSQTADEMSTTLSKYQGHISEIEQHLRTVEAATIMQAQQLSSQGFGEDVDEKKRELSAVLREFEAGIRGVAGAVAETREGIQRLQLGDFIDANDGRSHGIGKRSGIY